MHLPRPSVRSSSCYRGELSAQDINDQSTTEMQLAVRYIDSSYPSNRTRHPLSEQLPLALPSQAKAITFATMERAVTQALSATLRGLDETILEYISGAVADQLADDVPSDAAALESLLKESVAPFLVGTDLATDDDAAAAVCAKLAKKLLASPELQTQLDAAGHASGDVRVLENTQSIEEQARKDEGAADAEQLLARMWGFDKIRATTNDELEAQRSALSARQVRKQIKLEQLTAERDEEAAELDREWEDARFLPDLTQDNGERDVHVPRLSINFKGKTLLSDTALKIVAGRRYGLVGKNGAGKTTLLRYISHYELEGFPRHIRIQLVEQESASKLSKEERSVLEVVLAADYERSILLKEEKELAADEAANGADHSFRLKEIYDRLVDIDSDTAESRARTILSGLQFPDDVMDGPAKALSGGWRMRTALAGALFMAPDLLLLDEPTNHLDLEAVIWLEHYLEKYDKQMIVVSHDRNFLNAVTTDIIHLTQQKLMYYKGDYNTFENTMKENLRQQRKAYDAQQMKIQHMQEFIERFRANAKKAPLVQSRVKALDKILRNELIDEPEDEHAFRMHFPPPEPLGRPIIAVEDVGFRYSPESPLLFKDVHMGVDMTSRIGILGVNGSGKSTLINIMIGKLRANEGSVTMNPRLRVATFTQHHVDSLDLSKSAVQNMKEMFPGHEPDEFRSHLGRFNLSGELAIKPTRTLSGGQKSRVGFAVMTWRLPHVVVLDEPTNHLDMETIDALIDALREYRGGVVIVSHDEHFVKSVCEELWVVGDEKVARFRGTMSEYKHHVLK
jgi:ATP-binding cassette subfamily F protein 3